MRDEPLLWDEHGRPLSREGEMVAPAAFNVAQVYQLPGKLFPYRWDEAMRDAPQAALAMRRDAFYRSLIQERIAPTVNTEWQVEVDDPDNPVHQMVANTLQRAWRAVPDKVHLISWLLSASIWYGRAAVQGVWGKTEGGIWTWVEHEPVNGDSIQFQWDGTPVILVSKFTADKYRVLDPQAVIGMTDRGGFGLRLYQPEYRTRFIILKHSREASDYFEGEMAGGVHGVGVRSWVYWNDYFRRNALYAMIDWLTNVGMADILVFNYPANNIEARQRAEENAKKLHNRVAILCGRNPNETYPPVEQISLSADGINALKDWISTYADRHIRELIVGQTMSSGADREDGLGGTGRAEFAKDTKYQLVKTDTLRLAEALTKDWLIPARNFNFPGSQVPVRMRPLWDDLKQKERAENVQKAISWGVPVEVDEVRTVLGLRKPRPGYPTVGGNSSYATPNTEAMAAYTQDPNVRNPQWHPHKGKWRRWTGKHYEYRDTPPEAARSPQREMRERVDTAVSRVKKAGQQAKEKLQNAVKKLGETQGGRAVLAMGRRAVHLFRALERRALYVTHKVEEIAVRAAQERGLPPEKVEKLKKILYVADFVGGYLSGAAAMSVAGPLAGKAAAFLPSASIFYLAYSTARNPKATFQAAKNVIKGIFRNQKPKKEVPAAFTYGATEKKEVVQAALRLLKEGRDPEWTWALFCAALGYTRSVLQALRLARLAVGQTTGQPPETFWLYERLQPGSYHQTAKGWTAKNPSGVLRWFPTQQEAQAWAQGANVRAPSPETSDRGSQQPRSPTEQSYVEKAKQQRATAAKLHQRLQEERKPFWDVIAQSQVAPSVALEAAAYSLVSGVAPRAIWQAIQKPGEEITPIGDGHDVRAEEGKRVILLDAKTRLQKKGVVITDRTERISKILETLQALEQGKDVFSGYLHSGPNGLTLVTGYPEKTEATYTDIKTDVSEWLDALRGRLSQQPPDYDTPLPALRLESGLRVGASGLEGWGKDGVQLARERLRQALEAVLEDEDLSRRYREFLKEQGYKRLGDRLAQDVKTMGPERFAEAIKQYLKDSPELARRLMEMVPELRKAAFEVAAPEEVARAAAEKDTAVTARAAAEKDAAVTARAAAEKDALTTAVAGLAGLNLAPEKIAEFLTAQGQKVTVEQIRQILERAK